jgi:hypothetical protein
LSGGFCGGETKSNLFVLLIEDLGFFESYRKTKREREL